MEVSIPFEEGIGTSVSDTTGNGHDGTINGATWSSGAIGQALHFDGIDDYVELTSTPALDFTDQITMSAWVKLATVHKGHIIAKEGSYKMSVGEDGLIDLLLNTGDGWASNILNSTTVFQPGQWYHVAATYEAVSGAVHLYVNGRLDATTTKIGDITPNTQEVTIGIRDNDSLLFPFNGVIDEVRLYSQALSANEILAVYAEADLTPPMVFISASSAPDADGWYASNTTLTLIGNDDFSGVDTLEYKWNDGNWTAGTTTTIPGDGVHTISYRGTDLAGNGSGEILPLEMLASFTAEGADPLSELAVTELKTEAGNTVYSQTNGKTILSSTLIPVDPAKSYTLTGKFKSVGEAGPSKLYFGLAPYDENQNFINVYDVLRRGNDAVVSSTSDTAIEVTQPLSGWCEDATGACASWHQRSIGIYYDGDTTKRPDYVHYTPSNGPGVYSSAADGATTIPLNVPIPANILSNMIAGTTVVKNHYSGGTYMYSAASNVFVPTTWTEFTETNITGEGFGFDNDMFRLGTKYVKIMFLLNYSPTNTAEFETLFDDISFSELTQYRLDTTVPTREGVTLSETTWTVDGSNTYDITYVANDFGSGVWKINGIINHHGDNSANRRGYLNWRSDTYTWSGSNSGDRVVCSGNGGYADKYTGPNGDGFGQEHITLVGCASAMDGNELTVTFTVRPELSFGEFNNNDISFRAIDRVQNATSFANYDLNFVSESFIYDAQYLSQAVPSTMTAGQDYAVTVTMLNTENDPWSLQSGVELRSQNQAGNTTWGLAAIGMSDADPILNGGSKTFSFTVTAPTTAGIYDFQWQMADAAGVYFGEMTPNVQITVEDPLQDAGFVSQNVPDTMTAGQTYQVTVTVQNSGNFIWTDATGLELRSQNPAGNNTWGITAEPLSASDAIAIGANKEFSFDVTAPATAGTYDFQWQMADSSGTFFGELAPNLSISVTAVASIHDAEVVSYEVPANMSPGETGTASVVVRNVGSSLWDGNSGVQLRSQNPAGNSTWGIPAIGIGSDTDPVFPGSSKRFSFTITAPTTIGTYDFQWQMADASGTYFGEMTPNVAVAVDVMHLYNSQFISQTVPAKMIIGQPYNLSIIMQNTGLFQWSSGVELRSQNPANNSTWGRVTDGIGDGDPVFPGEIEVFNFVVIAPFALGTHSLQWQTALSGAFFGAMTPNVEVEVVLPDFTPPIQDSVTVSEPVWEVNNRNSYAITLVANDADTGIRDMLARINFQGDNSGNQRGFFSWREDDFYWGGDEGTAAIECSGAGGFAQKYIGPGGSPDGYGGDFITLEGCASVVNGNQKSVTLTVRPHADFGDFANNDISMSVADYMGNSASWTNYNLNFASETLDVMVADTISGIPNNPVPRETTLSINWTVSNPSNVDTSADDLIKIGIYLSEDGSTEGIMQPISPNMPQLPNLITGNTDPVEIISAPGGLLLYEEALNPLSAGSSETYSVDLMIPNTVEDGTWYLLFVVDSTTAVLERDESNNVIARELILSGGPEARSQGNLVHIGFEPGEDYFSQGVELLNFGTLPSDGAFNCNNGSPTIGLAFNPPSIVNVPSGFTSVEMQYTQALGFVTGFNVWSEVNAGGSLVDTFQFVGHSNNGTPMGACVYDVWFGTGVRSVAGKSIQFFENDGNPDGAWHAFDDIFLTVQQSSIVVHDDPIEPREGESAGFTFGITLSDAVPVGQTVEIKLERVTPSGNGEDLAVLGSNTVTFTSSNSGIQQPLTIWAPENDSDNANDQVMFRLFKSGGSSPMLVTEQSIAVTEIDDDFFFDMDANAGGNFQVDPNVDFTSIDINNFDWGLIEMTAVPDEGFEFDEWITAITADGPGPDPILPDGDIILPEQGRANPSGIDHLELNTGGSTGFVVTANFRERETVTITMQHTGNGTTTVDGQAVNHGQNTTVFAGQDIPIVATQAQDWVFSNWSSSPTGIIADVSAASTTVNTAVNGTITANFSFVGTPVTLNILSGPNGGTSPSGIQNLQSGDSVNVTVDPDQDYIFDTWTVISGNATITEVNPTTYSVQVFTDAEITANFKRNTPGKLLVKARLMEKNSNDQWVGTNRVVVILDPNSQYINTPPDQIPLSYPFNPILSVITSNMGDLEFVKLPNGDPVRYELEFFKEGDADLTIRTINISATTSNFGFCLWVDEDDLNGDPPLPAGTCVEQFFQDEPMPEVGSGSGPKKFLEFGGVDDLGNEFVDDIDALYAGAFNIQESVPAEYAPQFGFTMTGDVLDSTEDAADPEDMKVRYTDPLVLIDDQEIDNGGTIDFGTVPREDKNFILQFCNFSLDKKFFITRAVVHPITGPAGFGFALENNAVPSEIDPGGAAGHCEDFQLSLNVDPDAEEVVTYEATIELGSSDDISENFTFRAIVDVDPDSLKVFHLQDLFGQGQAQPVPMNINPFPLVTCIRAGEPQAIEQFVVFTNIGGGSGDRSYEIDQSLGVNVENVGGSGINTFALEQNLPNVIGPSSSENLFSIRVTCTVPPGNYEADITFRYRPFGSQEPFREFFARVFVQIGSQQAFQVNDDNNQEIAFEQNIPFGNTDAGDAVTQSFTIAHTADPGTPDLIVDIDPNIGNGFTLLTSSPLTIVAGQSASFDVRLDAEDTGTFDGMVLMTMGQPVFSAFRFDVSGSVFGEYIGPYCFCGAGSSEFDMEILNDGPLGDWPNAERFHNNDTLEFPATPVGQNWSRTIRIHNTDSQLQNLNVFFSAISGLLGSDGSAFTHNKAVGYPLSGNPADFPHTTIPGNQHRDVVVNFAPQNAGEHWGIFTVNVRNKFYQTVLNYTIYFHGSTDPVDLILTDKDGAVIVPGGVDYLPEGVTGEHTTRTYRLTNNGNRRLTIRVPHLTNTDGDFSITQTLGPMGPTPYNFIESGGVYEFDITYLNEAGGNFASDVFYRVMDLGEQIEFTVTGDDPPALPDLEVVSALGNSGPDKVPGVPFNVGGTVKNTGMASAAGSTVRVYFSSNTTLEGSDHELGSEQIGVLNSQQSSIFNIFDVVIPEGTPGGQWYFLFVADDDRVVPEANEGNNLVSIPVTVRPQEVDYDLIGASTAPGGGEAGDTLTTSTTVTNRGLDAASSSSVLSYYFSINNTLDGNDIEIGSDTIPALDPDEEYINPISVTIPTSATPGTRYIIREADADNEIDESNETNNTMATQITILETFILPVPTGIAATDGTFNDKVRVSWNSVSGATSYEVWRDINATISGATRIANFVSGTFYDDTGAAPGTTYYYRVRAVNSAGRSELSGYNTGFAQTTHPDLIIVDPLGNSGPDKVPGVPFAVAGKVKNIGTGAALSSSIVAVYLSSNTSLGGSDIELGSEQVGTINPQQSNIFNIFNVTIPVGTAGGQWYFLFEADAENDVSEINESNNLASIPVTVRPQQVDYIINGASTAPGGGLPGTTLTTSTTVTNRGLVSAASNSSLRYYFSNDNTLDGSDVEIGSDNIPSLDPDEDYSNPISVTIPANATPGTRYIIREADANHQLNEFDENNNIMARQVTVLEPPDVNDPLMWIDAPAHDSTQNGTIEVKGWALDETLLNANHIEFTINGDSVDLLNFVYGTGRADVCNVHSSVGSPNCPLVGWRGDLNTTNYSNGTYLLKIIVTDDAGNQDERQRTFTISN